MKAEKHRLPLSGDITIEVPLDGVVHGMTMAEALELSAEIVQAVEGEANDGEWVSIDDRLPDEGENLFLHKTFGAVTDVFDIDDYMNNGGNGSGLEMYSFTDITHFKKREESNANDKINSEGTFEGDRPGNLGSPRPNNFANSQEHPHSTREADHFVSNQSDILNHR